MPVLRGDAALAWTQPYRPLLPQGDLQTIAARYWPAPLDEARFPAETVYYDTEPGVRVSAKLQRHGAARTLLLVHGLTACTEARYMRTLAARALERGWDVVRLNVRNCGGTEALCPTLYHSGLTADLAIVVAQLAPGPLAILGFSMGGNMALKLAGEWGEAPPAHVRAVAGVSVPIRLDACSRRIGEARNRVYEYRFLRELRATLQRKAQLLPERFAELARRRAESIWEFDDVVTAPAFGFDGAADYYRRASCAYVLDRVRLPSLLIQAEDDPFIPFEIYRGEAFAGNPHVHHVATRRGGHVAFLASSGPRFWAEAAALDFFESAGGWGPRQPAFRGECRSGR